MSDQVTRVSITADASQANREFSGWAGNVKGAAETAKAALRDLTSHTGAMQAQVKADLGKVEEVIGSVTKRFAAWAAVVAGGTVLKGSIDTANTFTKEATGLAKALGINTKEAATLNVALGDVYSSADTMTSAASKLAKQVRTNEADLNALGIATRTSGGQLRGMNELMMDTLKVLGGYEDGLDRTMAMQIAFGKGADEVGGLLKLNNDVIEEAKKKQQELGLTVSVQNVEGMKRYRAVMNDVGDVLLAVKKAVGDAVMPIFTKLGEWFAATGPAAVVIIRGAIGGLSAVFWGLKNAVVIAWEVLDSMVFTLAEPVMALATALYKLVSGDFKGATEAMMSWPDKVAARWSGAWKSMVASSEEARDQIANLFLPGPEATSGPSGKKKKLDPNDFGDAKGSRMAQWEAELAERKAVLTRQGLLEDQYREMNKTAELAYWDELKARNDLTKEERIALARKAAETELALIRDGFEVKVRTLQAEAEAARTNLDRRLDIERQVQAMYQQGTKQYEEAEKRIQALLLQREQQARQLRESRQQAERDARLQEVELARIAMEEARSLGLVNQDQVLQAEAAFEQRRFAIAMEALQQRKAAAATDPSMSPVEREKILREMEQLEQQHQLRMAKLAADANVQAASGVTNTLAAVQTSWASLLQQLAKGQITIAGFLRGLFRGVAEAVVNTLSQMVAQWAIQQIAMKLLGKATALSAISTEAAKAGAGGVASMAAAPFPLNMTAPAFGAAMSAAALAFTPMLAAEQGFDIPAGVNPVVQAHQREMILPGTLADTVRDMANVYQQAGPAGSAEPALQLRTMGSFGDWLMVHRHDLGRAIERFNKDKLRR